MGKLADLDHRRHSVCRFVLAQRFIFDGGAVCDFRRDGRHGFACVEKSMSGAKVVQRIAILGAESSGKTLLAQSLAEKHDTLWVPEYLRRFVDEQQRTPLEHEQIQIARAQLEEENRLALSAQRYLFCDTTPFMTALYSQHYFGRIDPELIALEAEHDYDFIFVTAPDFPWVSDGLQRESPAVRKHIHETLLEILDDREQAFILLEGSHAARMEQAQFALEFLLV